MTDYIDDLIDAGRLLCWFDGRSKSFRDWSGNGVAFVPSSGAYWHRRGFRSMTHTMLNTGTLNLGGVYELTAFCMYEDWNDTGTGSRTLIELSTNYIGNDNSFSLYKNSSSQLTAEMYYGGSPATGRTVAKLRTSGFAVGSLNRVYYSGSTQTFINGVWDWVQTASRPTGAVSFANYPLYIGGRAGNSNVLLGTVLAAGLLDGAAGVGNLTHSDIAAFVAAMTNRQYEQRAYIRVPQNDLAFKGAFGVHESKANLATGHLENSTWDIVSGNVEIDTENVDTEIGKIFETSFVPTTLVRNNGATDSNSAYGTWDLWAYKSGTGTLEFALCGSQESAPTTAGFNGYSLTLSNGGVIELNKITSGAKTSLMATAASTFSLSTWHRFSVTRSPSGEFTVYLNGSPVAASTGSNPVTDNTYTTGVWQALVIQNGDKWLHGTHSGRRAFSKHSAVKEILP